MRTPRFLLVAGVAAATVLSACGGGTATPPGAATGATPTSAATAGQPAATEGAAATTDPGPGGVIKTCELFTVAELNLATGADYGDGVDDGYGQCTYRVGGADHNDGKGQIVVAVNDATLSTIKGMFGEGGVDVTVEGKAAFWNPTQGLASIWVDLGTRVLVLTFDPVNAGTQAIAVDVAELAVAGL